MKKLTLYAFIALAVCAFPLFAGCRGVPRDTTDIRWQARNTYDDFDNLMSRIARRFKRLERAAKKDDAYLAAHYEEMMWNAEVIAALAPQLTELAEEPLASNQVFWTYAAIIEKGAADARVSLLHGNWDDARTRIGRIGFGYHSWRIDFVDR